MKVIPLSRGKEMLVDDADFEELSAFRWYAARASNAFYARRTLPGGGQLFAHRQLMPWAEQVDHANGNTLDNRRANLRAATRSQNQWNKGPQQGCRLKGVCLDRGRWKAVIYHEGRSIHLGNFSTAEEAARAHDAAALALRGRFAWLNFAPDERGALP